ncbi:MAG: tetratricopeptide repeat protein [Planctomycetota bacterium]
MLGLAHTSHVEFLSRRSARAVSSRTVVTIVAAALLFVLGGAERLFAQKDTIEVFDGADLQNVEITAAKWDSVAYKLGKTPQTIESAKVKDLKRDSSRMRPIRDAIKKGDFPQADKLLDAILGGSGADWEKAEAAYRRGELHLRWSGKDPSKLASAETVLADYLKAQKTAKDFYVPAATLALGKVYLEGGKFKEAGETFRTLKEFGGETGRWGLRGKLGAAWVSLKEEGAKGALAAKESFIGVINSSGVPADLKQEALLGQASALNIEKLYDQTISLLNKSFFEVKEPSYDEHFAEASRSMGEAVWGKKDLDTAEIWLLQAAYFSEALYPAVYRNAAKSLVALYEERKQPDRVKEWQAKLAM